PGYLVGREKMREFARAVFASSPLNTDPEAARAAGYPDVVAPPTFAIVVTDATLQQLLEDPEAGGDFSRVVHGDQRFAYARPGGGHSMVTAESEIVDDGGAHVVTATSTLVVRGDE